MTSCGRFKLRSYRSSPREVDRARKEREEQRGAAVKIQAAHRGNGTRRHMEKVERAAREDAAGRDRDQRLTAHEARVTHGKGIR